MSTQEEQHRPSYYALPGQRDFPSTQVDTWLKLVLDHLGATAPAGEVWSGHSLRIGAASAADAIGVTLRRICWMGGWSSQSSAVKDYIDPTCPSSNAARLARLLRVVTLAGCSRSDLLWMWQFRSSSLPNMVVSGSRGIDFFVHRARESASCLLLRPSDTCAARKQSRRCRCALNLRSYAPRARQ